MPIASCQHHGDAGYVDVQACGCCRWFGWGTNACLLLGMLMYRAFGDAADGKAGEGDAYVGKLKAPVVHAHFLFFCCCLL
ncbi:hypothetical protein Dimus_027932 [Dionaea muscipula]